MLKLRYKGLGLEGEFKRDLEGNLSNSLELETEVEGLVWKYFLFIHHWIVIFCFSVFVSGVNVSCKQELVTADLSLVTGSPSWPLIGWQDDSLTCSEHGDNYNYRRETCSRKCCSGALLCSTCQMQRMQRTAGDSQETLNLFHTGPQADGGFFFVSSIPTKPKIL